MNESLTKKIIPAGKQSKNVLVEHQSLWERPQDAQSPQRIFSQILNNYKWQKVPQQWRNPRAPFRASDRESASQWHDASLFLYYSFSTGLQYFPKHL